MLTFKYTHHSKVRAAQRGLTHSEIEYILKFGTGTHAADARLVYLRKKDIPSSDLRIDLANRLVGTALVFSREEPDCLITVWRNKQTGFKKIRQKQSCKKILSTGLAE